MSDEGEPRTPWTELPADLRREVGRVLGGDVVHAVSQASGFSPGSADRVLTGQGQRGFVKAVSRDRNPDSVGLHRREINVMRALPASVRAPRLLGSFDDGEWVAIILEDVPGRHPGSTPDGSDLFAVLAAIESLPYGRGVDLPRLPEAPDELADAFQAWSTLRTDDVHDHLPTWVTENLDALEASAKQGRGAVRGDFVVHLDCRADNVLIDDTGEAWLVDWPWAAIGARWLDGLTYLLDARFRGEQVDAERVLLEHPLFAGVPASTIDAVLSGLMGYFFERARLPAPPSMPTLRSFQFAQGLAAMAWLQERWGTQS